MIVEEGNYGSNLRPLEWAPQKATCPLWRHKYLPPFSGRVAFDGRFPGLKPRLKPWAEGYSPFGAQTITGSKIGRPKNASRGGSLVLFTARS
jgi:hypothetical protein